MARGAISGNEPLRKLRNRWRKSDLGRSMGALSHSDQKRLVAITLVQSSTAVLDLLGVVAIGLLGTLSVTRLEPDDRVSAALRFLHISNATFQTQVYVIGASAIFLLIGRTILSILFTRRVLFFLSRRSAVISSNLTLRLLSQPLLVIQSRTMQETLFAITNGVTVITLQILATSAVVVADISFLIVMGVGLLVFDTTTAIVIFSIFGIIGFVLYRMMHVWAGKLGVQNSVLNIQSNEKIVEVFSSYRESVVRNRRNFYAREIRKKRFELANNSADISFMPYISKYTVEVSVILGGLLVGFVQFTLQDATQAIAALAVFLAAGSRIAPAVLRVQQGAVMIRGALGQAQPTLDLIDELGATPIVENLDDTVDIAHEGFNATIQVSNISLTYPGKQTPAISDMTFEFPLGTSIAFVGQSGAGKTSIIDILLGVLSPDTGSVLISGLPPVEAIAKWPGAISYVPQDVVIAAGSIRENVALGYPPEAATDELIMSALKLAHLDKFIAELPLGVDTQVGERGAKISGGQRQRLGIARAMFTCPHLLVLDEATSSLDGETEASISEAIHALRGTTTVVMIAHRLSTVRNADIVVYLEEGKLIAKGTFDEVRNAIPDFDRQAKLMGL